MLKRLARVVWWLGALSYLVAALILLNAARLEHQTEAVPRLKAELGRIQAKESVLASPYVGLTAAHSLWGSLGMCDLELKDPFAPTAAKEKCAALVAQAKAVSKEIDALRHTAAEAELSALIALIAGIAGLVMWAIAYILGGSFWRPPSTS